MSTKINFNLFKNAGEHKDKNTFRAYVKGGDYTEVVADYYASSTDKTPARGTGIKAKSVAGNDVIRVNVGVGEPRHFYSGTLNFNDKAKAAFKAGVVQPDGEAAGVFGTVSDRDGVEMDVSGWVRKTEAGDFYISCVIQDAYVKPESAATA